MKDHPILFSGEMVRALLDGRKTQTRRIVNPQPIYGDVAGTFASWMFKKRRAPGHWLYPNARSVVLSECPYGEPGNRLWVRETWAQPTTLDPGPTFYRANYPACVPSSSENVPPADEITWKPSIHMPRALSRITLEVTGVRVERLQDISEADAIAEGIERHYSGWRPYTTMFYEADGVTPANYLRDPRDSYRQLWGSLNAERGYGWDANPWVWVVEFRRAA